MAARTVSELANWDGRRDQQRQNSKWPTRTTSSSRPARDPYHTSLKTQPAENARPPGRLFDQKRVERSSFHSSLEHASFTNSSSNKELSTQVDTTSMSSHGMHHSHRLSISSNVSSSRLQSSSFTRSSKSSRTTPNSSVHVSRVHKPQFLSSSQHVSLSQVSVNNSGVIDLTLDDSEDELPVGDKMVPNSTRFRNQGADPGSSRRRSISKSSSPVGPEESLFTPPPPSRKRVRLFMNHLVVPPFPKGLTKADYQPMSEYLGMPLPSSSMPKHTPRPESPVIEQQIHPSKGKEREHTVPCPRTEDKQLTPPNVATDADLCLVLDTFDEPTMIPLQDDGTYPSLTTLDLGINTRFYFAHAWRANASRLQKVEPDWMLKILGKPSVWAPSVRQSSPRLPGTTGYVSGEQLRSWELVPPESSLLEKQTKDVLEEQIPRAENHTVDADHLPLPDDSLPVSNVVDPPASNPTVSQGLSSTAVDMDHDMNQYFDGLGDSPHKQLPFRQQFGPTHTFRPHILQFPKHTQMNAFGVDFPSLELDSRLTDACGNECFLGVPPSPTTEDIGPSVATQPTEFPFESASYFPASPSNAFPGDAPPSGAWAFEQGDGPLPGNDPPPSDQVSPLVPGTIDPSLLGLERPQTPSVARKDVTPKKRSKLPEPVIYVRRPMDPSSLPLLSGKRSVQIKYRDAEGSSVTPSTQTRSNGVPSNAVNSPAEGSTNDGGDLPRLARRSAPTRKLVEAQAASDSDSDCVPEASASQTNKSKLKRPSGKDKESVSDIEESETETAPAMSYCHQCRNKTARPKMMCSNVTKGRVCGKRFCNRCILYRYPDITFDEHSAGFLCPVCTNTCNCSHCSRNRGEEFVSMRLGGVAASLFTAKVTLVRDDGSSKPLHRAKLPPPREAEVQPSASASVSVRTTRTPTPEPGATAVPMQSQFWAHVYGMEGERVGSAFMTREYISQLCAGASSSADLGSVSKSAGAEKKGKKRTKQRTRTGPRVFIGQPLASWKIRAVRDLEPNLGGDGHVDVKGKGKARADAENVDGRAATRSRRRRHYIGNPAALHEVYGRMPGTSTLTSTSKSLPMPRGSTPVLHSDGSLTPSDGEDGEDEGDVGGGYWPQPAVGEYCLWAPGMMTGMDVGPDAGLGLGLDAGTGSSSGSSGMDVDADGVTNGVTNGDEREPVTRTLSEDDMARAISAALAALSVDLPLP